MVLAGLKRIIKDLREAQKDDSGQFRVEIDDNRDDDDDDAECYYQWFVTIKGPKGSLYEGGEYFMRLWFADDYPFKPPMGQITTPIFHPNIGQTAYGMRLDHMRSQWHPEKTGVDLIKGVIKAMEDPDPDLQRNNKEPLRKDVAYMFKHDREQFNREARRVTKLATPSKPELD